MKAVQRILGKIVGETISVEEMKAVAGGKSEVCAARDLVDTFDSNEGGETHGLDVLWRFKGCDAPE